jgi:hypothetical protein
MGMAGSVAGSQLPQSRGTEAERTQQDASVQKHEAQGEKNAESASEVGETAEDQESSERDADGRRLWEKATQTDGSNDDADEAQTPRSRDASGERGGKLDLCG